MGTPPDIVNQERRDACKHDLHKYLLTYHPSAFPLEFSADHLRLIKETQKVILEGGSVVAAFPRGSGKTTIFQRAEIWAAIYGHVRFPMLIAADDLKFRKLLRGIKTILESNQLLLEDFPEVIFPIRALDRIANRANFQEYGGEPTYIRWGIEEIVFPTYEHTLKQGNAGIVIAGGGLTGAAVRGGVLTTPSGEQVRPDCVLIDDPQTRKSAKSSAQVQEREDIVSGDILGMAGPGKRMAAMVACTVIYQDDLADRLLDRERNPGWATLRIPMIRTWPKNMALWEKYDSVRRQELLEELPEGSSNSFYTENRSSLEDGAEVYWEHRIMPGKLSALQSAMDEYFSNPRAFMAEKQNAPESALVSDLEELNSTVLAKRQAQYKRGEVPPDCTTITAHIDCQQRCLFYMIAAWSQKYGGHVVDYGVWPQQSRRYFRMQEIRKTLATVYKLDEDAALRKGIQELTEHLSGLRFKRVDGAEMYIERGLIDGRWKNHEVEAGLQLSKVKNWIPSYGVGIRAKDAPIANWTKKRGVRRGFHWVLQRPDKRLYNSIFYDTNFWKSQTHLGLTVDRAHDQAITLYQDLPSNHQLVADHWCAEKPIRVEARNRIVDEWELPANKPDNHYWDNLVGCTVAASLCGIKKESENAGINTRKPRPKQRVRKLNI